ncbi:MAG: hypothetical protein ACRD1C_04765 [Terriglobales bacterium]
MNLEEDLRKAQVFLEGLIVAAQFLVLGGQRVALRLRAARLLPILE